VFDIKVSVFRGIPRLKVTGDLVSGPSCQIFADVIDQLVDLGEVQVMVDLIAMCRIDSAGLGALIHGHSRLSELGGTLIVLRPSPRFLEAMARTRLSGQLLLAGTELEAINLLTQLSTVSWTTLGRC